MLPDILAIIFIQSKYNYRVLKTNNEIKREPKNSEEGKPEEFLFKKDNFVNNQKRNNFHLLITKYLK